MLRAAETMLGFELTARDGVLGKVKDFYFDDHLWAVRYFVVETGSWLNSRKILIAASALTGADWEESRLSVGLSQEQVRSSPSVDTERPVSRKDEAGLQTHYSWPAYWVSAGYLNGAPASFGGPALGVGLVPPVGGLPAMTEPAVRTAPEGDPHLRSGRAVIGYNIEASDGAIGHVEDFLVEDQSWDIRYLVIDTRNWLPGRKVVVFPESIRDVSWSQSRLYVDLTRERIEAAPSYDSEALRGGDYASRLDRHYGRRSERV